jgi:hypothetical protein
MCDEYGQALLKLPDSLSQVHVQTDPNVNEWADLHSMRLRLFALCRCAHLARQDSVSLGALFPSLGFSAAGTAELALVPDLLPLLRSERQLDSSFIGSLLADGAERAIMNADKASFSDSFILLRLVSALPPAA